MQKGLNYQPFLQLFICFPLPTSEPLLMGQAARYGAGTRRYLVPPGRCLAR